MSDSSNPDPIIAIANEGNNSDNFNEVLKKDAGVHFLTEHMPEGLVSKVEGNKEESKDVSKKHESQEYMLRDNGNVICKMCGEVLQSRTQWYRHKYKRHTVQPPNPPAFFQCEQCLMYCKSRKGYITHVASKHSELLSDTSPVLTKYSQTESFATDHPPNTQVEKDMKEEPDPELVIPKSSVPNYQTTIVKHATKATETKKSYRGKESIVNQADWEERRLREDKLVADIIDRVRRECEAQPSRPPVARKAYARRASTASLMRLRQTDAMT